MGSLPYNLDPNKGPVGQWWEGGRELLLSFDCFQVLEHIPSHHSMGATRSSLTTWSRHGNDLLVVTLLVEA